MSADDILTRTIDTPAGPLSLLARGEALVGCGFTADPGELHARLHASLRTLPMHADELPALANRLRDYFDGDLAALRDVPVSQPGTPGRQRLWAAMRDIPAGTVITYAELARRAGSPRAVRAAGAACAVNLIAPVIPCHRVVGSDGRLHGYAYGLKRKEWLLRHEGQLR